MKKAVYNLGIKPQLAYVHTDQTLEELDVIHKIFPDCIISGGDWNWSRDNTFPVREKVNLFAAQHGYKVITSKGTWLLQHQDVQIHPANLSSQYSFCKESDQTVIVRQGLPGIQERLSNGICKIAYLGASVTAQKQGYRSFLHAWFQKRFGYSHLEINSGIGGIGSSAAVFLMDVNVLPYKPDICLIEYTTGDVAWNSAEVGPAVEGMVQKLKAIGCQICFLHLYRNDKDLSTIGSVTNQYERVAEFYGIPSINVDHYIRNNIEKGIFVFEDLFRDHVHTHPKGAEVVANYIANSLEKIFSYQSSEKSIESCCTDSSSKLLHSDRYAKGKFIPIQESMIVGKLPEKGYFPYYYSQYEFRCYTYYKLNSQNEIQFILNGTLVGVLTIVGRESGIVNFSIAEQDANFNFWDQYCHYDRFHVRTIYQSSEKPTLVKIKLTDKAVDYSSCRRKIENPETIVKNLKIIGLLVCGEISY